jgi:diguanylate cyclase (GGDEF)-like protein
MKRRISPLRSKMLFAAIAALSLVSVAFIFVQMETLRSSSANSRRLRDVSTAQLVKLYVELEVPGKWRKEGALLYKGDSAMAAQEEKLRSALSEYLLPDTAIEFGVGSPPATGQEPADALSAGAVEPPAGSRPTTGLIPNSPPPAPELRFDRPDRPFSTAEGAGIAVRDGSGDAVGWILVRSGDAIGAYREGRAAASYVWSIALVQVILITVLSFLLFRLSRPIDVIAEARELAEMRSELLANMSRIDPLTGLLNRRGVEEAVAEARYRGSDPSHVAFVDIDRFKSINDARGHEEGDRVLAAVSGALARGIRQQDVCGRWGGEEFALVLYGMSDEGILATAERLRGDVAGLEFGPEGDRYGTTVTIGVATLGGRSLPKTLASADKAMYRGKREGRDRVVVAGPDEE